MGMGANAAAGAMGGLQQPVPQQQPAAQQQAAEDPFEKLKQLKGLLDAGVITQEDFEKTKAQVLGGL